MSVPSLRPLTHQYQIQAIRADALRSMQARVHATLDDVETQANSRAIHRMPIRVCWPLLGALTFSDFLFPDEDGKVKSLHSCHSFDSHVPRGTPRCYTAQSHYWDTPLTHPRYSAMRTSPTCQHRRSKRPLNRNRRPQQSNNPDRVCRLYYSRLLECYSRFSPSR